MRKRFGILSLFALTLVLTACPSQQSDNVKPQVSWIVPTEDARINIGSTVTLEVTASDNEAINTVEFFANGNSLGTGSADGDSYTFAWDTTGQTAGTIMLKAVATDTSGNQAEATRAVQFVAADEPTLTQEEAANLSSEVQADIDILATAIANDPVLGELLALLNLSGSVGVTGNDAGSTLHRLAPQQAEGEPDFVLPRGEYRYDPATGLEPIAPAATGKLIITTTVETGLGLQEVEVEVDWDVDSDTVVAALGSICITGPDGISCDVGFVEVPTSMKATISLELLPSPIAEVNLNADYHMTACGYFSEPSSLSVSGFVGVNTKLEFDANLTIDDTNTVDTIATSGVVGVIAGEDSAGVNWDISASGTLARDPDTCLLTGFKANSGSLTLGLTESVGDEDSSLEFNLDVPHITYDESGSLLSAEIDGNLKVNEKIAVTFAGVFDDADGSGIPGENVTLTFADGSISLEAFIKARS